MRVQNFDQKYNDFFSVAGSALLSDLHKRKAGDSLTDTFPTDELMRHVLCFSELQNLNKQKETIDHMFIPKQVSEAGYETTSLVLYRPYGATYEWSYQNSEIWKCVDDYPVPVRTGDVDSLIYIETTGSRSNPLYLSFLKGKRILLLFREDSRPVTPVSENPSPGEYVYDYNKSELQFGTPIELNETIQILFKTV